MSRKIIIQSNCYLRQEEVEFIRKKFKADFEDGFLVIPTGFSLEVYENDDIDTEVEVVTHGTI